jgi:sugar phosphate isomerase/epimerase
MKLALHSVSYAGAWAGQAVLPLEQVLDKAAAFGYDGVELVAKRPHASPYALTRDDRQRLKDQIAARGLELCCLAGYFDFSHDGSHADMPHLEKEGLWMRETLRLAADLDAPLVRTYSGFLYDGVPLRQQWQWCVEGLREGARIAGDLGVTLALQNHSEVAVSHADVLDLIREVDSPALKVCLDCAYLQMNGVAIEQAVAEVGDLIVHSHTSDHRLRPTMERLPGGRGYTHAVRSKTTFLGEGEVDYPSFVSALRAVGYGGYLSYEMCSPMPGGGSEANLDRGARTALTCMSKLLAEP